ncbi:MAG: zf-HC2 domain-containing protein [Acidobacteria bacterium]|nr:MAG: zf-HC2 domain-containing protein [Acidobacteriota bacterium]
MMKCREVSTLVSTGDVETAPLGRRMRVWLHIAMCRHCRRFRRQLEQLRQRARAAADEAAAAMPADLPERVLRQLPRE